MAMAMVCAGVTACSSGASAPAATKAESKAEEKADESKEETGGEKKDGYVIGLAMNTQTNPFFVDVKDGVQKAADEHGIELYITDAQDDPTIQMKDVENLITKNRTRSSLIPVILMQLFLRLRHAMRLVFRYLPWTVKQTAATLFPISVTMRSNPASSQVSS